MSARSRVTYFFLSFKSGPPRRLRLVTRAWRISATRRKPGVRLYPIGQTIPLAPGRSWNYFRFGGDPPAIGAKQEVNPNWDVFAIISGLAVIRPEHRFPSTNVPVFLADRNPYRAIISCVRLSSAVSPPKGEFPWCRLCANAGRIFLCAARNCPAAETARHVVVHLCSGRSHTHPA